MIIGYDIYFVIAAIFLAASFAFMTWQLATVKRWLAVVMLPVFLFGFYALGKGVYDHLGYATTKYPDSKEIMLYDYTDPLSGYTFLLTLEPVEGAKPILRAVPLDAKQKQKLRAEKGRRGQDGVIVIIPSGPDGLDFEKSTLGHLGFESETKHD